MGMDMSSWVARATEPLNAELVPYREEDGFFGYPILRHPLVFCVPLFSNGEANDRYEQKAKALQSALDSEDWASVVFLHERPYRTYALHEYIATEPLSSAGSEILTVARQVWVDSENLWQNRETWEFLFSGWVEGDSPLLLDEGGAEVFDSLPDEFMVYRGGVDASGFSWTTDEDKAEWFRDRFSEDNELFVAQVRKSEVMGVLWGRGESEIIVQPKSAEIF